MNHPLRFALHASLVVGAVISPSLGCTTTTSSPTPGTVPTPVTPPLEPTIGGLPNGTRLFDGDLDVAWVTSDGTADYVAYTDHAANTIAAAKLELGATPTILSTKADAAVVYGRRKMLLVFDGVDPAHPSKSSPTLSVWSATTPLTQLGRVLRYRAAAVSYDGARLMYRRFVDDTHSDIVDVGIADLASQRVLKANAGSGPECGSRVLPARDQRFVTWYCKEGATQPSAVTFAPDGTEVTLFPEASNSDGFFAAASTVAVITARDADDRSAGTLETNTLAGGPPVTIDSRVLDARLSTDGSTVFYVTADGALKRSPTTTAAPTVVLPSGVRTFAEIAENGQFALIAGQFADEDNGDFRSDVSLVSLTAAQAPTVLLATPTGAAGYTGHGMGSGFTTDSTAALYFTDVTEEPLGAGTLWAAPTAGGAPRALAQRALDVTALTGSHLMITQTQDGYVDRDADLSFVDTSRTDAPIVLARRARSWETIETGKLVYAPRTEPQHAGIYVVPLP